MANRRQFIQSGLVMSAMTLTRESALASGGAPALDPEQLAELGLEHFVFNNQFTESVRIAQNAASQGIPLLETSGDLTELWYKHLDLQWKQAPMTLAGVTPRDGLFVLETLAADYRMRVVYRSELGAFAGYASARKETLFSWIIAPC